MINLPQEWSNNVKDILRKHVPSLEVRVFGSRVTDKVKTYSDLDLVIMTQKPLPSEQLALLKTEFEESDIPIRVDIADWSSISESFQKIIKAQHEVFC